MYGPGWPVFCASRKMSPWCGSGSLPVIVTTGTWKWGSDTKLCVGARELVAVLAVITSGGVPSGGDVLPSLPKRATSNEKRSRLAERGAPDASAAAPERKTALTDTRSPDENGVVGRNA